MGVEAARPGTTPARRPNPEAIPPASRPGSEPGQRVRTGIGDPATAQSSGCRSSAVFIAIAGILGLAALVFGLIDHFFRSSSPYREALRQAAEDSRVQAALGSRIRPGWWVMGSLATDGSGPGESGSAELEIPLRGNRASGRLSIRARESGGVWSFERIEVRPEGTNQSIAVGEVAPPSGAVQLEGGSIPGAVEAPTTNKLAPGDSASVKRR